MFKYIIILLSLLFISCSSVNENKRPSNEDYNTRTNHSTAVPVSVTLHSIDISSEPEPLSRSRDIASVEEYKINEETAATEMPVEEIHERLLSDEDFDSTLELEASSAGDNDLSTSFEHQLYTANFSFTVTDTANIDDYLHAKFTIDMTRTIEEIKNELESLGIDVVDEIEISKLVFVDIVAPDFEVTNVSPATQPIRQSGQTNWKWKLKPKQEGSFPIELTVYAKVKVDGVEQETYIKSYDKSVQVEITPTQIIERWWYGNWEWAFSTLIIPIGLYYREKIKNLFKKKLSKD